MFVVQKYPSSAPSTKSSSERDAAVTDMTSAADRIAALRAKVAAERERTKTQRDAATGSTTGVETNVVDDDDERKTMSENFKRPTGQADEETTTTTTTTDKGAIEKAVREAIEREQMKFAEMMAAMQEANENAAGNGESGELRRRLAEALDAAREAERERGLAEARNATAMDAAEAEIGELRRERDKMHAELKKLRAHLLEIEDEEDEVAEEQEREIDEAREEERREYERKLSEYKKSLSGNDAEVTRLRGIVQARDEEVNNLQKALGAYYAEIESSDAQRAEAANLRQKLASLTSQASTDRAACTEAQEKARKAEETLAKFQTQLKVAQEECIKATGEASKLRKALHHALQKSSDMMVESEKLLDKRIVSDLFIAYLEREQADEILNLMSKMLGFTQTQKARMENLKKRTKKRGVIGKIARAPVSIAAGAIGVALEVTGATGENKEVPVADLWIDFLTKQVEANDDPVPTSKELITAASEL